jgi:K(+)-stimulated pyrophosphate-energized sodium pump
MLPGLEAALPLILAVENALAQAPQIDPNGYLAIIFVITIASLAFAIYLAWSVLRTTVNAPKMQEIADAIKEGAEAFLRRQYRTIIIMSLFLTVGLFLFYRFSNSPNIVKLGEGIAWKVTISFLIGAACSLIAGYIGMFVSIRANLRTAHAATKSLNDALKVATRAGAVSGLFVVAMSLLGVGGLFVAFGGLESEAASRQVPLQIVGFGFGASFVALFAQLGGGIYTKAADVGADLVGDNVGDCAGRGADLFESTAAENIGAMILGAVLYQHFGIGGILFPLLARAFGLVATVAGVMVVRTKEEDDPMKALNRGYYVTTILAMAGFYVAVHQLLGNNLWFFAAGIIGILTALAFVFITQYYTEYKYRPVKSIAEASQTGPATNIITGLAVAMECVGPPVIVISTALLAAYYCGTQALPGVAGAGFYGTAIATMGMLAPCAYILAMDTFGPITDNAGGIVEMSQAPEEVRRKTDRLDAVGNTTKALTKGYAIGSAALAAFLLFNAYLDEVKHIVPGQDHIAVDISFPPVFVGALLGATLVFVFSALAIRAVGRAAYYVINEVRRQFRADPGIMQGTSKPDYRRCVDIVTAGALKEMVLPGLLAVIVPVAVGISFKYLDLDGQGKGLVGAQAVAALLMVGTITGILLATMMNNGGGAWDNAKKYIEMGMYGGKHSETHKAGVVGDTVGDPLKDTAGPSLHVLIKLLSTITLVLAPLFL